MHHRIRIIKRKERSTQTEKKLSAGSNSQQIRGLKASVTKWIDEYKRGSEEDSPSFKRVFNKP